ncbi:MAG TPA: ABC transporter ATP-binding protein [Bacillota bacterium]|nr:ABC transporter ATP-binding protein [Bacillota bacterium]
MKKIIARSQVLFSSLTFSFLVSWRSSKLFFLLRVFLEILIAIQPVILILNTKNLINLLASLITVPQDPQSLAPLIRIVAQLLTIEMIGILARRLNEIFAGIHKDIISNYLNEELMKKTATLDLSFFDSPKFHDDLLNARRDSMAIESLAWFTVNCVRSGVQLGVTASLLAGLHWIFPFSLILLSIPAAVVEKKFTFFTYNWMFQRAPEERKMNYLQHILTDRSFAKDVRLYGLFNTIFQRYRILWQKWFREKCHITRQRSHWAIFSAFLPQLGITAITFYTGYQIINHRLTLGDFTLYTGLASQLFSSIFGLISAISQVYDNEMRISNYRNFLAWKPRDPKRGTLILGDPKPKIEFSNVFFNYPSTELNILKHLNFTIQPGEKIALVGKNGAGKSTIIKLLLQFYEPASGQIFINDRDIREYPLDELRKIFGVMFQDYVNYALTLRENIIFSDLAAAHEQERVNLACRISGVDQMAAKWPQGLDTFLTKQFEETGVELSGGEWQKVALARAFYRKGGIMILDEPSAALDPEAEFQLFQYFKDLCEDKGAIFISHHLSSIAMVDRILVLEGGTIIESGSHQELMNQQGRYAYLFNLQTNKYKV